MVRISNSLVFAVLSAVIIIVSMFLSAFNAGVAFGVDDEGGVIVHDDQPLSLAVSDSSNVGCIVVNEVMYDPKVTPDADHEWVELYNTCNETINLVGWNISDNVSSDNISTVTILPYGFVVIAALSNFSVNLSNSAVTIVFIEDGRIGNGLGNAGGRLILKDSAGTIIDEMSYGDDESITLPSYQNVADGHSLEWAPCGGQFIDNEMPTPGSCLPSYNQTLALTPIPSPVSALTQITPESNSSGSININQLHSTDISRSVSSMAHKSSSFDPSVESPGTSLRSLLITLSSALIVILAWMLYRQKAR